MKLLQMQYKFNKDLKLDPSVNMPECIKSKEHSSHCDQSNNNCSYISKSNKVYTDPKQLIEFLFHNQNEIYSTLQNKDNAKLVILYLMQLLLMQKSQKLIKFLKQCIILLNKNIELSPKKLFKIFKTGCELLDLKAVLGTSTAFISDISNTALPFAFVRVKISLKNNFLRFRFQDF